jgi:hypothetical protein
MTATGSTLSPSHPPHGPLTGSYLSSKANGLATISSLGTNGTGGGPSQYPTLEDRVRWAQMAEHRAAQQASAAAMSQNVYAVSAAYVIRIVRRRSCGAFPFPIAAGVAITTFPFKHFWGKKEKCERDKEKETKAAFTLTHRRSTPLVSYSIARNGA